MAGRTEAGLSSVEAWVLGRLVAGKSVDLTTAELRPRWRSLAHRLIVYPMLTRSMGWNVLTADLPDRDAVVEAVAKADPNGPRPDDSAPADDGVIAFKVLRSDVAAEGAATDVTGGGGGDGGTS